jgi:predicted ATPase
MTTACLFPPVLAYQISPRFGRSELIVDVDGAGRRGAEAESCFQEAIEMARTWASKLELHASTSLARLWQEGGKRKEAQQLLGEIYAWFTEGFDTADLQEAASLLKELS